MMGPGYGVNQETEIPVKQGIKAPAPPPSMPLPPEEPQAPVPAPQEEQSLFEKLYTAGDQSIQGVARLGSQFPADRATRIMAMGAKTGLPQDLIDRNLDDIEKLIREKEFNLDSFRKSSPVLADWLASSPYAAGTIIGDKDGVKELARLGKLEKYLTLSPNQWPRTNEYLRARAKRMAEAEEKRIAATPSDNASGFGGEFALGIRNQLRTKGLFGGIATPYEKPGTPAEQRKLETENDIYRSLLAEESVISGEGPIGVGESILMKSPLSMTGFLGSLEESGKQMELLRASMAVKDAVENGQTPNQDDWDIVERYGRLADAVERRGHTVFARTAEFLMNTVPLVEEFAATGGIYGGVKELVTKGGQVAVEGVLKKAVQYVVTHTPGAVAGVLAQAPFAMAGELPGIAARRMQMGEGPASAWPKAYLDAVITVGTLKAAEPLGKLGDALFTRWAAKVGEGATESGFRTFMRSFFTGADVARKAGVGGAATGFLQMRAMDALKAVTGLEKWPGPLGHDPLVEALGFGAMSLGGAGLETLGPRRRIPNIEAIDLNADAFRSMGEALQESGLMKRSPEVAEQLVERMTKDDITVPVAAFNDFYAQKGIDPRTKAVAVMGDNGAAYDEAMRSQSDIVIPRSKAVTRIAADPESKGFDQILSYRPGEMSPKESEAFFKAREAEPQATTAEESTAKLQAQLKKTLVESGKVMEDQADTYAKYIANFYRVQGLRAPGKVTAEELFKTFPLTFQREGFPPQGALEQPAYHGSPHKFEKFSLQKIGTGEGAQAYGWGLYFAGAKEAAQFYKNKLGASSFRYEGKQLDLESDEHTAAEILHSWQGDKQGALEDTKGFDNGRKLAKIIKAMDYSKLEQGGKLYTVDIPEDSAYLDYDKALKDQSPSVKKAIADFMAPEVKVRKIGSGLSDVTVNGGSIGTWPEEKAGDVAAHWEDYYPVKAKFIYQSMAHGGADFYSKIPNLGSEEAASRKLASLGIPGIKYLDQASRGKGEGTSNYVIFDENLVKILGYEQPPGELGKAGRGAYIPAELIAKQYGIPLAEAVPVVMLQKGGDPSTPIHETAHHYLEVLTKLAALEGTDSKLKSDVQEIFDFTGIKDLKQWQGMSFEERRAAHEKWAEAVEDYGLRGKSPSRGLRAVITKFWEWLTSVYKGAREKNIPIPENVTRVMDRMLATDEEIAAATRDQGQDTASDAFLKSMPEEKADSLRKAIDDSKSAFKEELRAKLLEDIKRKDSAEYKERFQEERGKIAADVNERKEYKALSVLQTGKLPDGQEPPVKSFKLSEQSMEGTPLSVLAKTLPEGTTTKKGGVDINTAAEMLGFDSGEALVRALETAAREPKDALIDRLTTERMGQIYPELMQNQEARAEAALDAIHEEKRAYVMRKELEYLVSEDFAKYKGLKNKLAKRLPAQEDITADAERAVLELTVRSTHPEVYSKAEARAARETTAAMDKGDWDAAFDAHLMELVNYERYRAASAQKDQVEKDAKYVRKFRKEGKRKQIGKADYTDHIEEILARFGLARVPKEERLRRRLEAHESLESFIKAKEGTAETMGEEVYTSPLVLDESIPDKDYRDMKNVEFNGMMDTVRQLEHVARELDKMQASDRKVKWEERKAALIASVKKNGTRKPPPPPTLGAEKGTPWGWATRKGREFDASLIKVERLIHWMSGGDLTDAWNTAFWNPAADAQTAEYDLSGELTAALSEAVINMPKAIRKRLLDKIEVPGAKQPVTRMGALTMFLNSGNISNLDKMTRGELVRIWNGENVGLSPEQIKTAINTLTKEELDYGQSLLDIANKLGPRAFAFQKEMTGLEPEKITAEPIETIHGRYPGGYYPMMYDPAFTRGKNLDGLSSDIGGLVEPAYVRATTPQGHLKARTSYAAPVDFTTSIDHLPGHIAGVIKDLTHRKFALDANRIVNDPEIKQAILEHMGPEYHTRLKEWVQQVVNDKNFSSLRSLKTWAAAIERLRLNVGLAHMGFKASVALSQGSGLANSAAEIGPQWLGKGMMEVSRHPVDTYRAMVAESGEMRHRQRTIDRDLRAKFQDLEGRKNPVADIQRMAMQGVALADLMVAMPTYYGGKAKALAEGASPENAIRAGERAVRLSQGAAGAKDLSAIQTRHDLMWRLATMYYGWANAAYSTGRDIQHDLMNGDWSKVPKRLGWAAMRTALLWPIAGAIAAASGGGKPKKKDEALAWYRNQILLYPFQTIPIVRDVANAAFTDYGYQFTPVEDAFKSFVEAAKGTANFTGKAFKGELRTKDVEAEAMRMFRTAGYIFGLPTGQVSITGEYLKDLMEGDVTPGSWDELAHDLFYRRPRERNRD